MYSAINHLEQFDNIDVADIPKEFVISKWKEIQSLDKRILEVGSHTKNHPNLTNLTSSGEFEGEIKDSKEEIEKNVGYKIDHFCYPAGEYNEDIIKYLKKFGYKSAVTIINGFNDGNTDLYQLKRIAAPENFIEFKFLVSGSYSFFNQLKTIFHKN
jgi:peptidoglycan/xylan/chitin deacetylase (PgdA/CDA1 family)